MASKPEKSVSDRAKDSSEPNARVVTAKPRICELMVITGHIHQVREWRERLDGFYFFETIGTVVAIYEPCMLRTSDVIDTVLVVKDKIRVCPTLKVFYPSYDRPLPPYVKSGNTIRIIGKLDNKYSMRAMKITFPTCVDINHFDRITHVCYKRIQKYLQDDTPKE